MLVGGGLLADSVLERMMGDADISPMVVNAKGQPLWLGRTVRSATSGQWLALLARDGGCKVCGAAPEFCEAHHVVFWSEGGECNIGNFVLLCTRHHHELHDHNLELFESDGVWALRPRGRPKPFRPERRSPRPKARAPAASASPT